MIIQLTVKCSDTLHLATSDGREYSGYVPEWFPEDHYGDYVYLDIDTTTGQIVNWKPISDFEVGKIFGRAPVKDYTKYQELVAGPLESVTKRNKANTKRVAAERTKDNLKVLRDYRIKA